MKQATPWTKAIAALRKANDANSQLEKLLHCRELYKPSPTKLIIYHDALLFLIAYPFNKAVYELAQKELQGITTFCKQHQNNLRWKQALMGSGLPFTELHCQYSASILRWLIKKFPNDIYLIETPKTSEISKQVWQTMLPEIEFFESTQGKQDIWSRVKQLSGHHHDQLALQWILDLFHQQTMNPRLKELLFDDLSIFIKWKLSHSLFNRTNLRCPINAVYYKKIQKIPIISGLIIRKPLTKPLLLTENDKLALIDCTRASLAFYYRETDPLTFADPDEIAMYDMGHGLQICLTGMQPGWRLSLESYVGFMAFKNGVPMAYGGGWIFGHRCKIGVNIYPPFRGAESDQLFCQVMRLYFQVYNVKHFVVKPYQFGKGNPEGIKTGAFWFYFKLGFKPKDTALRELAELEWEKIIADTQFRTSINILKKFTASNLEYEIEKNGSGKYDAETISKAVTLMIVHKYSGNRERAVETCMKELKDFLYLKKSSGIPAMEQKVWNSWSLLLAALPHIEKWKTGQRKQFLKLLQLRSSGKEHEFITALQKHRGFWTSVQALY